MTQPTYGSVCSGIEAASIAWEPLGWKPLWFAEIEPFPSAVLAHHWPNVPNLGDFTRIKDGIAAGTIEAPDVLVGGTPCQAFSFAGLRESMDDARGQLTLEFVRLADAIDEARSVRGRDPGIAVWENVPGVLSTHDNAFGCFLGALAGEDGPLEPPGGRWTNAGHVRGPKRTIVWRTLDAQYFGVAQRRRRVFVVASARTDCGPEVLFEFDGVRRDSPPSRQQGQGASADAQGGIGAGSHWDGVSPHPSLTQSSQASGGIGQSNQEIFSQQGSGLVPAPFADCADTLTASMSRNWNGNAPADNGSLFVQDAIAIQGSLVGRADKAGPSGPGYSDPGAPQYTLTKTDVHAVAFSEGFFRCGSGHAPSDDGKVNTLTTNTGDQRISIAFDRKASGSYGFQESPDTAGTLRGAGHGGGHGAFAFAQNTRDEVRLQNGDGSIVGALAAEPGMKQTSYVGIPSLASCDTTGEGTRQDSESTTMIPTPYQVRRLTPVECARLQGFPDYHTRIPWRNKPAEQCPDGPQYKGYGNSMCTKVMRWIGNRLDPILRNPK